MRCTHERHKPPIIAHGCPDGPPGETTPHVTEITVNSSKPETVNTGIQGLDFVLQGGLPRGRPSLIRGGPGTGKTVISLTFLCHGISQGEPGVLVTFDEDPEALLHHAQGFGFPADTYVKEGRLRILDMRPDQSESAGEGIELTAILTRIEYALKQTGAERLVLDAIDGMEGAFLGQSGLRKELNRVFDWVRDQRVTTLITTGELENFSTRFGLEDYIADCVIALKQEVQHRVMTRLLRVVKRRGGPHSAGEFPFLLDSRGIFMVPVSGAALDARVSSERISSGVPGLDEMLGGEGPYKGSTILLSGQAGTGKTSLASAFAQAACRRGEKVLYISFEESVDELVRNQSSIGGNLAHHAGPEGGHRLIMEPVRAIEMGLEEHLMRIMRSVSHHDPDLVLLDPVSSFTNRHEGECAKEMLLRLMYLLKEHRVTTVATELLSDSSGGVSHLDVSSMIDVWIKLRRHEGNGEMNRLINVIKARGLAISNQVKEFRMTDAGMTIEAPYIGESGIVYGTARHARQEEDDQIIAQLQQELDQAQRLREEMEETNAARERLARAEREAKAVELDRQVMELERRLASIEGARSAIRRSRQ